MPSKGFPHDSAYKTLFSFPSMVKSLLLDFLPEEFVQHFDFSALEPAKASFVRNDLKQLHNDIVWRLRWRGKPCVLALILEFQSSDDYWMGARIFAYTGNFWLDYIKSNQLKTGALLPAVFPIVLYNGERPWKAPTSIQALIDLPYSQFMATQPGQIYHVIDARRVPADMLAKATGAAAYIIRGEQARTGGQLAKIGMDLVTRQTEHEPAPLEGDLEDEVVKWLEKRISKVEPDWLARKEKEQAPMMLSELLETMKAEIKKSRQAARAEGLAEGRAEGLAEGKAAGLAEGRAEGKVAGLAEGKVAGLAEGRAEGEIKGRVEAAGCQRAGLLEMLALKFGEIPTEWEDYIAKLDNPRQLTALTVAVLTTQSPAEYGQLLATMSS